MQFRSIASCSSVFFKLSILLWKTYYMEYKTIVTLGGKKSWIGSKLGNKNMRNRFLVDFYIGYVCQKMFWGPISHKARASWTWGFIEFPWFSSISLIFLSFCTPYSTYYTQFKKKHCYVMTLSLLTLYSSSLTICRTMQVTLCPYRCH